MRTKILFLFLLGWVGVAYGQKKSTNLNYDLSFDKDTIKVYDLKRQKSSIVKIGITGKYIPHEIKKIKIIEEYSDFKTKTNISLSFNQKEISKMKSEIDIKFQDAVYMTIKLDSLPKMDRKIIYRLIALDSLDKEVNYVNTAERTEVEVILKKENIKDSLSSYKYLSFIGTNFDLVEGIKTKNLFFATNVFRAPYSKNNFGFYLSLYGNRTMSLTEKVAGESMITEIFQNSTGAYFKKVKTLESSTITQTADNLGAHFSTLFAPFKKNDEVNVYVTVSADFIWKRNHYMKEYGKVIKEEDIPLNDSGISILTNDLSPYRKIIQEYQFNIGPGLFLSLENKNISVKVHGFIGYGSNAINNGTDLNNQIVFIKDYKDLVFSGRAWITEPKTGITLQAEINNRLKIPRPFYGVTLSKAFNLDKLAGIFEKVN